MKEIDNIIKNKLEKEYRIRAVRASSLRSPMENVSMPLEGYKNTKIEHPDGNLIVGWDR